MAPQHCSATTSRARAARDSNPSSFDWRDYNRVSEVKNQGQCGSCWTFSTTGAMESHYAIAKNTTATTLFSEQQLVDCAQAFDNNGCDGGLPSQAFEYIRYNGGITLEKDYVYTAKDGACNMSDKPLVGHAPGGSFNITAGNEDELENKVVSAGPISIAFEVVDDFMHYTSGVYSSKNCGNRPDQVNHAVLVVGYGVEGGQDFWEVKNSWGTEWGNDGYFRILKGVNECGLADCAAYPLLGQ